MNHFDSFCRSFGELVAQSNSEPEMIEGGLELLSGLVSRTDWFPPLVERLVFDHDFIRMQKPSVWKNEITLYRPPDRGFVVLAYLWERGFRDAIHDHSSWGIIGVLAPELQETRYSRLDGGKKEGYARLEKTEVKRLRRGDLTVVFPFDGGIHKMENASGGMAISVNVYGKSVRRGYINFFDQQKEAVYRAYAPASFKQVLAVRALNLLDKERAQFIAASVEAPAFLKEEVLGPVERP